MDNIKFRIWNPGGKNMLHDVENVYECLMQQIRFDGTQPSRMAHIKYDHRSEGMVWMMYSGVKTVKDHEIYSGDIVKYTVDPLEPEDGPTEYVEEVKFVDGCFVVDGFVPVHAIIDWGCEVIGNVYENPELLEV